MTEHLKISKSMSKMCQGHHRIKNHMMLNKKGKLVAFEGLDPKRFKQPEGITFMPNGDMVLSNEGQKGKANILVFKFQESLMEH